MQYDALYSPRSWTQHEHKRLADLIRDNEIERRILICGDVELGGLGGMALNLDLSLSVLADSTTPSRKPQSDTDMDMEAKPDNHATYTTVDMATLNPDLIDWNRVSRVVRPRFFILVSSCRSIKRKIPALTYITSLELALPETVKQNGSTPR